MFRDMKWYAREYGYSIRTIQRRIEWIKAHASRYPEDAVVYDGTKPFVREDVFEDLIRNRNNVDAGLNPAFKEGERCSGKGTAGTDRYSRAQLR